MKIRTDILIWFAGLSITFGTWYGITNGFKFVPKDLKNYIALCGDKQYKLTATSWEKENSSGCHRFYDQQGQISTFVCHCYMISEIKEEGKK